MKTCSSWIRWFAAGLLVVLCALAGCGSSRNAMENIPGMVDAQEEVPRLLVDLTYAKSGNLLGESAYGDMTRCYLQQDAARMLARAADALHEQRPDLRLLAHDCARPVSVQKKLWEKVKGKRSQKYVANPHSKTGSVHSYGCALDLTLADKEGTPLDMGSSLAAFDELAQPNHEFEAYAKGKLTARQWSNRLLLRMVMVHAGFLPNGSEWWHFNCTTSTLAWQRYPQIP